ncbi:hypothetical protein ABZ924_37405 [Streptomyces sp. NPDC046876]|uniref:hypothetical protein n=1 Tax=Streptomyces sp. NPDC046876 TaxID=3155616 RepID=UPI0033E51164
MSSDSPVPPTGTPSPPPDGNPSPPPEPPEPPAPRLARRLLRRFADAHRSENRQRTQGWLELVGGYLAILAVTAGALWAAVTWWVDHRTELDNVKATQDGAKAAQSGPELKADLKVALVSAEIRGGLKGGQTQGEVKEKSDDLRGAHVDITVQNLATAPSLISKAKLTFRQSFHFEPCYGIGGDLVSTIAYDLTIPDDQPMVSGTRSHKVPFERTAELTHQIPANSYEKFTLTTGPETTPDGGNPWVGVFDIELTHDGGKVIKFGPVAAVSTGGNPEFYPVDKDTWHIGPQETVSGCTDRNAKTVRELLKTPGLTASAELKALDKAFASSGH